ncbi:cobalamin-independent methionine synthase II family protein [Allokutzneria multivorans]|uniref:Cobalamin-independent methionine synthase II family protein n=1 Tax=Allokutzneria multivorans TaxID=1142134 RepID=A0ABP7TST9_9PSEU
MKSHVVGSLLRPPALLAAREHQVSAERLRELENEAVDAAIALQEAAGIDVITDGEQRRGVYFDSLAGVLDGITPVLPGQSEVLDKMVGADAWHTDESATELADLEAKLLITGRLARRESLALQEFEYASQRAKHPLKVTLPSPSSIALVFWSDEHSTAAYRDVSEAMDHVAELLREEISALAARGCRYVQVDAPDLTFPINEAKFFYEAAGLDRDRFLAKSVELLNSVMTEPGVTFSTHVCRGNNQGQWHTSGGYGAIAAQVFPRLDNADLVFLEYDDERSGGFEPLAEVPDDKVVVLGLISTKTDVVESRADVERRIEEAARFHPLEKLAISPQCGFASAMQGNPLSEATQRAKLELVGEIGRSLAS